MNGAVIFIEKGHTRLGKDQGAAANGYKEAELTTELGNLITNHLINLTSGIPIATDDDKDILIDVVKGANNVMNEKSISLSIHFNAATPKATGVEVIYPDRHSKEEFMWAVELSKLVSGTLGLKDRGAKPEALTARKRLYIRTMKGHNLLLETCFLTNVDDMKAYEEKKGVLALQIAMFLIEKYHAIN